MIFAILPPILVVAIATLVITLVVTKNSKHSGKVGQGCCGSKVIEPEDGIKSEVEEDEVIYGEIRYPEEVPQPPVISLPNPLYSKAPVEPCTAAVEHSDTGISTHAEILRKQLSNIPEMDKELNDSSNSSDTITDQLSSNSSDAKETLTTRTVTADPDTCKILACVSQSNSSEESIKDEVFAVVPNPAYNYKETYLAAQRAPLQLNPAYNRKSSFILEV